MAGGGGVLFCVFVYVCACVRDACRDVGQGITSDVVNGVKKNVLKLTAINEDDPDNCPGPKCHKIVSSSGSVSTANITASGRYTVIAKVPKASGLIWAVWTFHFEQHLPHMCNDYSCYCSQIPPSQRVPDHCAASAGCLFPTVCDDGSDGWVRGQQWQC